MSESRKELILFVNGKKIIERNPQPDVTLLYFLRNSLGLKGSKQGCNQGGCGACTVMVSKYNRDDRSIRRYTVCACITLLCSVDGLAVTTVEGIGSPSSIHPVQERIARAHGTQCGFCSPGMVMSMYALLRNHPRPSQHQVERALEGNLCRCTGYRPILDGCKTFSKEFCCGGKGGGKSCCKDEPTGTVSGSFVLFDASDFKPYDPTQEPIFPPELMVDSSPSPLFFEGPVNEWQHQGEQRGHQTCWVRPVTLEQLLQAKRTWAQGKIVAGGTQVCLDMNMHRSEHKVFIDVSCVSELTTIKENEEGLLVGAACSLDQISRKIRDLNSHLPASKTKSLQALLDMIELFEGDQVKNSASLGGNLVMASSISDLNAVLMCVGALVNIASTKGDTRQTTVAESFIPSHNTVAMAEEEILLSIEIPFSKESEHVAAYSPVVKRREESLGDVNASFKVDLESNGGHNVVKTACFVFGGWGSVTVRAQLTEQSIQGLRWDTSLLEKALPAISADLATLTDASSRGYANKESLSRAYFYKFYRSVLSRVASPSLPPAEPCLTTGLAAGLSKSCQGFQDVPSSQPEQDTVGKPLAHLTSLEHTTGTAVYIDDMPSFGNELFCGIVHSTRAHAKIVSVDWSEALSMPGVWGRLGAGDLKEGESNVFGPAGVPDELVFAVDEVTSQSQTIGIVLADNKTLAQRACSRVQVKYQELPSLLTIQEAIEAGSFYDFKCEVVKGNVEEGLEASDHVLSGEVQTAAQDHFYMETQAVLVVPRGSEELEVFSSTQMANGVQLQVSKVTGIPAHKISVRVQRLGGGFGGKVIQSIPWACLAAIAAKRCGRPVRVMLDRDEDMASTGPRHPFLAKYRVGCKSDGKITAVNVDLYSNGGSTSDLSNGVANFALFHIDNAYFIPNWKATVRVCKTNIHTPTAFRAFGIPQATFVTESIITQVALACGLDPTVVRHRNLYNEGDRTHVNQLLTDCHIHQCWDHLVTSAAVEERKKKVVEHNREHRCLKRGLAVVPMKRAIFVTMQHPLQGGALVHIYLDGTVLVSHGGVEMGQGINTKMVQICARVLGIPTSRVHISESATSKVPNSTETGGSISTDIFGPAVKNACETLRQRLSPYMEAKPKGTWEEWVMSAYLDRVNLSVNGFHKIEGVEDLDWENTEQNFVSYHVYGAACSEVEVDMLTGEHRVLRTDIVMDVGESLNPAIDIGQIEGAFIQGYGMYMLEEPVLYEGEGERRGALITTGPGSYKLPRASHIPEEFNVSLLPGVTNKRAIYSSKGVGEVAFPLATSVHFAVHDAVASWRRESGMDSACTLNSPATSERVRQAAAVDIQKL